MITLHLGVLVVPYADLAPPRKKGQKRAKGFITTGDVAEILEDRYHIMAIFFEERRDAILEALAQAMMGAMETSAMTGSNVSDPYAAATTQIEAMFREFISTSYMERLGYPGIPTQAALRGVNHRLKHPYRKSNPRRPSFRDTGLYMNSMKAWVD